MGTLYYDGEVITRANLKESGGFKHQEALPTVFGLDKMVKDAIEYAVNNTGETAAKDDGVTILIHSVSRIITPDMFSSADEGIFDPNAPAREPYQRESVAGIGRRHATEWRFAPPVGHSTSHIGYSYVEPQPVLPPNVIIPSVDKVWEERGYQPDEIMAMVFKGRNYVREDLRARSYNCQVGFVHIKTEDDRTGVLQANIYGGTVDEFMEVQNRFCGLENAIDPPHTQNAGVKEVHSKKGFVYYAR